MLRRGQFGFGTHRGPLLIKQRKVRSTAGQYGPNPLGYTRPTMVGTMGCHSEIENDGLCQSVQAISRRKEEPIPKTNLGPDRGLQLTLVTLEFVVIGF